MQGPHQLAQKSIKTGTGDLSTSASKLSLVIVIPLLIKNPPETPADVSYVFKLSILYGIPFGNILALT
ncbi:hypothetical protein AGMMS49546_04710 [Spirochaetia bacterium]|nr:hypothetical protein AGMMS49546_04710 [Spirochaetia bacterium]